MFSVGNIIRNTCKRYCKTITTVGQRIVASRNINYHGKSLETIVSPPSTQCRSLSCSAVNKSSVSLPNTSLQIPESRKYVDVIWQDGRQSRYHSIWLRFNCRCPDCTEKIGLNWLCPVHEIPMDLTIKDVDIAADGSVRVTWNEDDHKGVLTTQYMKEHCYSKENIQRIRDKSAMTFQTNLTLDSFSWNDVQRSDDEFYNWMKVINEKGICLLTDVPTEHHYLKNVLSRIGHLTGTIDGEIWYIYAQQDAVIPAYTNSSMEYHMDLAFYEAQPGIQFLHCLEFDDTIKGGETLFIDMFHVAEEFRKEFPEDFEVLRTVPYTFWQIQYARDDPIHMIHRRPIFETNDANQIVHVSWHPHEQGPPLVAEDKMEAFYKAYQRFARCIDKFPYKRDFRYKPGDMMCFNNRRMAHGRNKYDIDSRGTRYLQGSYVNVEDFKSKLHVLSTKLGKTNHRVSAMGNSDWTR